MPTTKKRKNSAEQQATANSANKKRKMSDSNQVSEEQYLRELQKERILLNQKLKEINEAKLRSTNKHEAKEHSHTEQQIRQRLQIIREVTAEKAAALKVGVSDFEGSGMTHQHSLMLSKFASANDIVMILSFPISHFAIFYNFQWLVKIL